MAQVTYTITYNANTLTEPTVDRYTTEPVLADDDQTLVSNHHVMAGTSIITATTNALFNTAIADLQKAWGELRADLTVNIDDGVTDEAVVNISAPDQLNGPKASVNITRMMGARAALVAWEVEWWDYAPKTGTVQDILSHWWSTAWSLDEQGQSTMTVTGGIQLSADASVTVAGVISIDATGEIMVGDNADAYRLVITPPLPSGFRRQAMEYALDDTGRKLLYVIIAVEKARDLPSPATSGNANFTWKSSIHGDSLMGRKTFEVELVGPANTQAADLLKAAVLLSKNRIRWSAAQPAGPGITAGGVDLVESIQIDERNMFDRIEVAFRVTALSVGDSDGLVMPNTSLLSDLLQGVVGRYEDISPWGSAQRRAVRRTIRDPTFTDVDQQSTELNVDGSELLKATPATAAFQFPAKLFNELEKGLLDAGAQKQTAKSDERHIRNPYVEASLSERVDVMDTGMRALKSRGNNGATRAFQVHTPTVILTSKMQITRVGAPPTRQLLTPPANSIVKAQGFYADEPRVDKNGNTLFRATYWRRIELLPVATDSAFNFFGGFMVYWPPNDAIRFPFDPRTVGGPSTDTVHSVRLNENILTGNTEVYER